MNPRALVALLALGATWGASFLFIKAIVDETSALEVTEGRIFIGALAVGTVVAVRRTPLPPDPSLWIRLVIWSLIMVVIPFILIAWGEEQIASGRASVLNSTMPLFTALFAAALLKEEQLTPARQAGLVVGLVGVIVLTGGQIYDLSDSNSVAQLAVVGAAACYGAAAVYSRSLLRRHDPVALSGAQLALATVIVLPIMLGVRGTPNYSLSVEAWGSLVALGLWTGLGTVVYMWLVDNIGSVRSSLIAYIVPVVGLFLGWAVLDESIGASTIMGTILIVAGVAAVMRGQAPSVERPLVAGASPLVD